MKILRLSTNNSLYVENGTRQMHSFYEKRQEVVFTLSNGETPVRMISSDPSYRIFMFWVSVHISRTVDASL